MAARRVPGRKERDRKHGREAEKRSKEKFRAEAVSGTLAELAHPAQILLLVIAQSSCAVHSFVTDVENETCWLLGRRDKVSWLVARTLVTLGVLTMAP